MFCADLAQEWVILVVILIFVLFAVFFNGKPQRAQLLPGGTVLNLTSNRIEPLLQTKPTDMILDCMEWVSPANDADVRRRSPDATLS